MQRLPVSLFLLFIKNYTQIEPTASTASFIHVSSWFTFRVLRFNCGEAAAPQWSRRLGTAPETNTHTHKDLETVFGALHLVSHNHSRLLARVLYVVFVTCLFSDGWVKKWNFTVKLWLCRRTDEHANVDFLQ